MSATDVKKVIFLDIRDQYSCGKKLNCLFKLVNYEPFEGDRIAIYKSGFSSIKDYVLFEWVSSDARNQSSVTFLDHLHINDSDFYQFCYISGDNEVLGASKLFQFIHEADSDFVDTPSDFKQFHKMYPKRFTRDCTDWLNKITNPSSSEDEENYSLLDEVKELREENVALKMAVRVLAKPSNNEIKKLEAMIHKLSKLCLQREEDIVMLKGRVAKLEKAEQDKMSKSASSSGNSSLNSESYLPHFDLEIENIPPCPF